MSEAAWSEYNPEDQPKVEDLSRRTYGPLHDFADEWRHVGCEQKADIRPQGRFVLESENGELLGYAGIHTEPWMIQVSKRRLDLLPFSNPEIVLQGAQRLETLCRAHAIQTLQVRVQTIASTVLGRLTEAGYSSTEEMWDLVLEVGDDSDKADDVDGERSYCIASLAELSSTRPSAFAELHALWIQVAADQPGYDPATAPPLEKFISWLQSPVRDQNGILIAYTEKALLGLTMLQPRRDHPGWLTQNITGVVREWRRQGVAKALKQKGVSFARSVGALKIVTSNSPGNEPVLKLNVGAGFVPAAKWLTLEKPLA